ncbi:peptidylprolyl isomerase [Marivivens donghaensis]|uniref:Parvulin-like PPIase n=1 Tax=Marivivens donghaensis TaxID=1699413 RepID=A0ABX0VXX0_9RHOB|nr:peptidylprolyl isomerase [Marivivens donghaensis]NIY72953.1 peptidylprolyl isomerase [Marivivens donghaensis]
MRAIRTLLCAAATAALLAPVSVQAQGLFSPAIMVNDQAITNYELNQRVALLEAFNTPGNPAEVARQQLIDDALRRDYMASRGIRITDEGLQAALEEFAGRANQSVDQFVAALASQGIEEQALRDYVEINSLWRDFIRREFRGSVDVSDRDIDTAIASELGNTTAIQVLLSEIIIPAPPERAAEAMAIAERLSRLRSTAEFSAAAAQYSAVQTKENGGRLPWKSLDEYPAGLGDVLLALEPGEVTQPLPIPNGVALLQLRDLREVDSGQAKPMMLDYAVFTIGGGLTAEALAQAAQIDADTDSCDDLYGVAKGLPEDRLTRTTAAPSEIENDIAMVLAGLDEGESAAALTRNDGQTLLYVMLCSRLPVVDGGIDRETVANRLSSRQLAQQADLLLARLRANATIVTP